jgi:flagellar motor switch/type III secretory pathway protein FliN
MQLDSAGVAAVCQQAQAELGEAIGRALGRSVRVSVGEPGTWGACRGECVGGGLLLVMGGERGVLGMLGEGTGLLPPWVASPDATGRSRLATLAQELFLLSLPEGAVEEAFAAGYVGDLWAAAERAAVPEAASALALQLADEGGKRGVLYLVWPALRAQSALQEPVSQAQAASRPAQVADSPAPLQTETAPPPQTAASVRRRIHSIAELPAFTRSLLRINVPLVVTLASRKQPVARILDLGPGSILQFDKPCDELLEIEVGGRCIARGEAVKVGDKFGIRIADFSPVGERFCTVRPVAKADA